jgi:autotransporter-associated beta strand protein
VLTIPSNITTSAGLTKFGIGSLALTGTNTFGTAPGSALAIHGGVVQFTSDGNLGTPGLPIVFGMPSNPFSPNGTGLQYTGTTAFTLNRNITTNSFGGVLTPVGVPLIINGNISGKGAFGLTNAAAGTVYELNGTNTFQGDFYLSSGHVGILSDAAFGNAQTIQLNSGTSSDGIDLRGNWTTSRTIHVRNSAGLNTNGFNATLNGPVLGSISTTLTKNNNGTLTLTATNPFFGVFSINAGEVRLFNQGAINRGGTQAVEAVGFGAALTLDDTGTHFSDRLPDAGTVSMNNATFNLRGNASVTTEEVIGTLAFAGGQNTVTVTPGAGQAAILRLGNTPTPASRVATASVLFRGTSLGVNAPGTADSANIMVVNPLSAAGVLVGGGGPAGSTAVSVIPAAFGDTSATGLGTQLVTYDFDKGVRLLTASEYYNSTSAPLPNGVSVRDNVRLTTTASVANATTVNALWLDAGGSLAAGTGTLTVTSGSVLVSAGNGGIAGSVSAGATVLAVGGPGDLTISGVIPASQTGGLSKMGAGTLTLSAANLYTGTTYLGAGTIAVGTNTSLGTGTLQILSDIGTLAAAAPGLNLANTIGMSGTLNIAGSNNLTLSGAVNLQNASRAVNVAAGLTVTMSGVVAGDATTAGIGLIKTGPGTLVLTGANTYGSSGNSGFYLAQTAVNGGELRVNNTSGSGTGGSAVVINGGGTLSGTGFIIPTQLATARNTVTVGSGATLSPGLPVTTANPGTLTVGSSTTPGLTDATVTLASGSKLAFYQNATVTPVSAAPNTGGSGTAGTANNQLTVLGVLNINPGATVTIAGDYNSFPDHTVPYSFQVATATSIPTAVNITSQTQFDASQLQNYTPGAYVFSLQSVGNAVFFNMTPAPVPEPSLVLAVCAAGAAAGFVARRRRPAREGVQT